MGLLSEFKDFAMRGNVVDLAVGVVIGGAFGKIVSSLVADIITPVIGVFSGGSKFNSLGIELAKDAKGEPLMLGWGNFTQNIIDFLIVAFCLFMVVKAMNTAKKRFEKQAVAAPPAPPSAEVQLLTEIRDSLRRG